MCSIHHSGTWFGIACWPFVWIADSCAENSVVSNTGSEIIVSVIPWKRQYAEKQDDLWQKICLGLQRFWSGKIYSLEQNTVCVLSVKITVTWGAALYYQYLFCIMLGTLVVFSHILFLHPHSCILKRERNILNQILKDIWTASVMN